ncbi:MAG: hypothetical protein KDJ15_01570 [Alphaproteobacteria bacterium]|nr:hypothetical protein [Alphaproteobacteria bacterium]
MRSFRTGLCVAVLILAGCETATHTYESAKDSVTGINWEKAKFWENDQEADQTPVVTEATLTESIQALAVSPCPEVNLVDDLRELNQFTNDSAPYPHEKVSAVSLSGVKSSCARNGNNMVVDMVLSFEGIRGPRTAAWRGGAADFVYPYFVAITDSAGTVMTKETFSVTMSYETGQDRATRKESLRQVIPTDGRLFDGTRTIMVGFQLTDAQLAYNRSHQGLPAFAAPTPAPETAAAFGAAPARPETISILPPETAPVPSVALHAPGRIQTSRPGVDSMLAVSGTDSTSVPAPVVVQAKAVKTPPRPQRKRLPQVAPPSGDELKPPPSAVSSAESTAPNQDAPPPFLYQPYTPIDITAPLDVTAPVEE